MDETTKQIIIKILRENDYEVYEDPVGSNCWWLTIGPGDININIESLELTPDLKWVQLKKKYNNSGDN